MAKSYNSYVGNGSTQVFSLTFPYLAKSHVKVYVGGVEDTTFTWLTSSSLTLTAVPANGAIVLIKRVTPTTPLIDFVDGSVVTENLLDTATIQSMYVAEETQDTAATAIILDPVTNKWQGGGKVLNNLADPVDTQDAVTKHWAQTAMDSQLAQATAQASTATTKATEAATSATSAASSATTATTKAAEASTSATNSANSATASASSATASAASASTATTKASEASGSATSAAGSASTATTKATEAANSATAAAASATSASNSASTATSKATEATTGAATATSKASEASSSATSAASSATAAATSATNASASATTATTKATEAAASASSAATNAATVASNVSAAATSATNAAASAADAATSATSAAASASSAAALLDNFDDRYLGAKSSAPTVDNDGNALLLGALYFDSTSGKMRVYTASGWLDASSASVATLAKYEYVATAGQTTFTDADANGVTLSYTVGAIVVSLNGALLRSNEYTATSGSSVVLASGANASDELVVYAFGNFLVADTYTRAQTDALLAPKASTSALNAAVAGINGFGFKNRIINGAMMIDQRNAGAAQTIANGSYAYTVDRWRASSFGATCTGQQVFSTNRYLYQFTGAASVTNIDINQRIESKNCLDLANQTITLSVDLSNSLLTSTLWQVSYANATDNFATTTLISQGNFTVNSTLTNYSVQVTLPANAINGLQINFTAGAQTSGTWKIGNVQLEKGSTATSFDYRPYGTELALCQRYCQAITQGSSFAGGTSFNTGQAMVMYYPPVSFRANPSMMYPSVTGANWDNAGVGLCTFGSYSDYYLSASYIAFYISTLSPAVTVGRVGNLLLASGQKIIMSAEL